VEWEKEMGVVSTGGGIMGFREIETPIIFYLVL